MQLRRGLLVTGTWMRRGRTAFSISLLVAALALGCGDDDDSESKEAGMLSPSEAAALCEEFDALWARIEIAFVAVGCTQQGRVNPPTCELGRKECIDRTPPLGSLRGIFNFQCEGSPDAIIAQCAEARVADLRACMTGITRSIEKMGKQFSCAQDALLDTPTLAQACVDLGGRCPVLSGFRLR